MSSSARFHGVTGTFVHLYVTGFIITATLQPNRRAGCTESLWPAVAGGKHNGARVGASAEVRAKVADERGERECCGVSGPGGKKKKLRLGRQLHKKCPSLQQLTERRGSVEFASFPPKCCSKLQHPPLQVRHRVRGPGRHLGGMFTNTSRHR